MPLLLSIISIPIVLKALFSFCNWNSACWPCMLHWFRYLKLRLSAFIKMGRGLGVALTWWVWHQTPGTFPRVLRSTDIRLMGPDMLSEGKMLMNESVSKMLLVLHWYHQRGWGKGGCEEGDWISRDHDGEEDIAKQRTTEEKCPIQQTPHCVKLWNEGFSLLKMRFIES